LLVAGSTFTVQANQIGRQYGDDTSWGELANKHGSD